jgi:hypothetical protein
LTSLFPKKWIRRVGSTAWPVLSELNPLDFPIWKHLKSTLYATEVSDLQELANNKYRMDLR